MPALLLNLLHLYEASVLFSWHWHSLPLLFLHHIKVYHLTAGKHIGPNRLIATWTNSGEVDDITGICAGCHIHCRQVLLCKGGRIKVYAGCGKNNRRIDYRIIVRADCAARCLLHEPLLRHLCTDARRHCISPATSRIKCGRHRQRDRCCLARAHLILECYKRRINRLVPPHYTTGLLCNEPEPLGL